MTPRKRSSSLKVTTMLAGGTALTALLQGGKWDINALPWNPSLTPKHVNDAFRAEAARHA